MLNIIDQDLTNNNFKKYFMIDLKRNDNVYFFYNDIYNTVRLNLSSIIRLIWIAVDF